MGKSEWRKAKLDEFIEFNPNEMLKRGCRAKKISMDKLSPFTRTISDFESGNYSGGAKFRNDDTIMARITPCLENGKTALVSILNENEVGYGSTEFIVLRAKKGISDYKFVYYHTISPSFRDIAIKSMVGTTGRQRVQQNVLKNLEVSFPPFLTQQKIASILSALDDKIELNKKINDNLEEQAQGCSNLGLWILNHFKTVNLLIVSWVEYRKDGE